MKLKYHQRMSLFMFVLIIYIILQPVFDRQNVEFHLQHK